MCRKTYAEGRTNAPSAAVCRKTYATDVPIRGCVSGYQWAASCGTLTHVEIWNGIPLRPLAGGYSGETFLVGDEAADQVVLRIYQRQPERAEVDAALLRLLDGVLPVPAVLETRPLVDDQPAVVVTSLLPGTRLDLVLASAAPKLRVVIGHQLGRVLARLSGIPMPGFGMFAGADLRLSTDGIPAGGLAEWAESHRDGGRLAAWQEHDWQRLRALVDGAETLLDGDCDGDAALNRRVLVHSDFNPKNILVDTESGDVTGILDWEFAHAGSPYADLGNLTRFERHPDFVEAVVSTFVEHAPVLVDEPLALSRAADLWALVELAGGVASNAVRELATTLLRAQARAGDLHAWPWETPRVDP